MGQVVPGFWERSQTHRRPSAQTEETQSDEIASPARRRRRTTADGPTYCKIAYQANGWSTGLTVNGQPRSKA
jgi:hypothetical protein